MKIFKGIVVSVKTPKTAVVLISRKTKHPLYGKVLTKSKKFKVDTAGKEMALGQTVTIGETRQISKDKYFKVIEIISKTPEPKAPVVKKKATTKQDKTK